MDIPENFRQRMSLLDYCRSCGAKCCKGRTLIAEKEYRDIHCSAGNSRLICEKSYFYLDSGSCPFLEDGHCRIQIKKPFVCLIFPFVPVIESTNRIYLYLVSECMAAGSISRDFIQRAKQLTKYFFLEFPPTDYIRYWQKHKTCDFDLDNALLKVKINIQHQAS